MQKITDTELLKIIENSKIKSASPREEKWRCAFLEWTGVIGNSNSTEIIEDGIIKGIWFIRKNGSRKKHLQTDFVL